MVTRERKLLCLSEDGRRNRIAKVPNTKIRREQDEKDTGAGIKGPNNVPVVKAITGCWWSGSTPDGAHSTRINERGQKEWIDTKEPI